MREDMSHATAHDNSVKVPAKVYGVMAVTTVLTFATLMTGYQLLFPPQSLFA
jgi:hypothetical protein